MYRGCADSVGCEICEKLRLMIKSRAARTEGGVYTGAGWGGGAESQGRVGPGGLPVLTLVVGAPRQ